MPLTDEQKRKLSEELQDKTCDICDGTGRMLSPGGPTTCVICDGKGDITPSPDTFREALVDAIEARDALVADVNRAIMILRQPGSPPPGDIGMVLLHYARQAIEAREKAVTEAQHLNREQDEMAEEYSRLEEELKKAKAEAERLEERLANALNPFSSSEPSLVKIKDGQTFYRIDGAFVPVQQLANLGAEVERLKAELANEIASHGQVYSEIRRDMERLKTEIELWRNMLRDAVAERDARKAEVERLNGEGEVLHATYRAQCAEVAELNAEVVRLRAELAEFHNGLARARKTALDFQADLDRQHQRQEEQEAGE